MPVNDMSELERKAAKAAYDRAYRAKNAEKLKARMADYIASGAKAVADAKYRASHKEELAAYKKVWHAENSERLSLVKKERYAAADPEVRREQKRAYHKANATAICAKVKRWVDQNYDRKRVADAAYYVLNSEAIRSRVNQWRVENPERKAANDKAWAQNNPLKVKLNVARRHKRVRQATPKWASRQELDDVYLEATHMQLCVDHIIPLKHKLVCGLHVAANLQLLTRSENAKKSNKFDPETYDAS